MVGSKWWETVICASLPHYGNVTLDFVREFNIWSLIACSFMLSRDKNMQYGSVMLWLLPR